jgi:hypothetical protein
MVELAIPRSADISLADNVFFCSEQIFSKAITFLQITG